MINMVEEEIKKDEIDGGINDEQGEEADSVVTFDVNYSCLRCGTTVSNAELSRLPEIKCICGFRVFTKSRSPVVKTVKAV